MMMKRRLIRTTVLGSWERYGDIAAYFGSARSPAADDPVQKLTYLKAGGSGKGLEGNPIVR